MRVEVYDGESRTNQWWSIVFGEIILIVIVWFYLPLWGAYKFFEGNNQDASKFLTENPFLGKWLSLYIPIIEQTKSNVQDPEKGGLIVAIIIEGVLLFIVFLIFAVLFHRIAFAVFFKNMTIWLIALILGGASAMLLGYSWDRAIPIAFGAVILKSIIMLLSGLRMTSWG